MDLLNKKECNAPVMSVIYVVLNKDGVKLY